MMTKFKPATGLSNRHLQSILSSSGPRKVLETRRAKTLIRNAQQHIITTPQGVKLQGYLTLHYPQHQPQNSAASKGLAIILHGWEGSANSLYVLSSGQQLLAAGYDVFRLNFRDHGDSHHLNAELFNSARLEEVLEAVKYLCQHFGGEHNLLCGYSLGGNFCLRVANLAKVANLDLHQAIAVCPVLHPPTTMAALSQGLPVYEKYFIAKWKRSLQKKLLHQPQLDYSEQLKSLTSLAQMNHFFITGYTDFASHEAYYTAYSLLHDALSQLAIPATIITANDDPMIPPAELSALYQSPWLNIELQAQGGHCAFIKNWKFESWASDRIVELANQLK